MARVSFSYGDNDLALIEAARADGARVMEAAGSTTRRKGMTLATPLNLAEYDRLVSHDDGQGACLSPNLWAG